MIKKLTFILLFVSTSFAQSKAYEFFNSFDQIIGIHGLKKVKTIGDSYMAVGGVPEGRGGHAFEKTSRK